MAEFKEHANMSLPPNTATLEALQFYLILRCWEPTKGPELKDQLCWSTVGWQSAAYSLNLPTAEKDDTFAMGCMGPFY